MHTSIPQEPNLRVCDHAPLYRDHSRAPSDYLTQSGRFNCRQAADLIVAAHLDYWTPNYEHRDLRGDGTNRIVTTKPSGALIRVSLMAMLYRRRPEESLTLTQRFRYWGSADPGGKDDYLYCEHWGVSDPETADDLAEFIQNQTLRMQSISQFLSLRIIEGEELRYTTVRGDHSRFLEVVRGMGFAATARDSAA